MKQLKRQRLENHDGMIKERRISRKAAETSQGPEHSRGQEKTGAGKRLYLSILLLLIAIISVTAATTAWFTIADFSRVKSVGLEIFSGANLRFDLDAHRSLEEYVRTLGFEEIAERISREQGFSMKEKFLEPVTTQDCKTFTLEDGTVVESETGSYLEFVLHFMAGEDMIVHLTSANSEAGGDGTKVTSKNQQLIDAMRISFTAGNRTEVYQPGTGTKGSSYGKGTTFRLPSADKMVLNDDNALFSLKAYQDLPVTVHIWLEGTDEACTDALRGSDYSIQLRFEGTDENNQTLNGKEQSRKKQKLDEK